MGEEQREKVARLQEAFERLLDDAGLVLEEYLTCSEEKARKALREPLLRLHSFIEQKQRRIELFMERTGEPQLCREEEALEVGEKEREKAAFQKKAEARLGLQRLLLSVEARALEMEGLFTSIETCGLLQAYASPADAEAKIAQLDVTLKLLFAHSASLLLDTAAAARLCASPLCPASLSAAAARFLDRFSALPDRVDANERRAADLSAALLSRFFSDLELRTCSTLNPYDPASLP